MLKAVYVQTNLCWMVLSGDSFTSVNGRYVWQTLKELKWDLKMCGLRLSSTKEIISVDDNSEK